MSDRLSRPSPQPRRWLVLLIVTALLSALLPALLPPVTAAAAGTTLFNNLFNNNIVDGTGTVTKPTPTPSTATNAACLSATGNSSTGPLLSCTSSSEAQGSGKLRLTAATSSLVGGVYGAASFPTSNGLDVTFNTYQYGGGGGDGMSFVLAATDPANPVPPSTIGQGGGSLGYSPAGSVRGLANAYLGVGLDPYGNFSSTGYQGSGCPSVSTISTRTPGAVVVRGPGNGIVGYCGLTTTYDGTAGSQLTLRATTRSAALVPIQVLVNPTGSPFTSATGVTVNAGAYKVVATPVGQSAKTLTGPLPAASTSFYPASSWVNANGVPKQLAFGFIGSTGSVSDFHEASNVKVVTFNQVPQLSVVTTSYAAAAPALGDPVSYVLSPSVQAGANVGSAVSVTQTAPTGVLPLAAYGSGWVCAAPVGQTVSCTTSGTSFAAGTTLPSVNVVGIVTATGITPTTVQNSSSTTVSSSDSNPGADTITTAGTPPTAPSGIALNPDSGAVAGGNTVTVTGSNITSATAVEVGTTAQFQAGSVVTLIPCVSGATASCFAVSGTSLLVHLPARASPGTVSLAVVTRGVSGSAGYVYADRAAAPAAPTATAGLTSATLTWVAPADNGRPITGYVVTPYLAGTAQTPVNLDPATLTRTIYGLTAGGSYTFTIAAVNALGTSAASSASNAVVPYTVLNAPTIGTVSAGTSSATVRWTAPTSTGGSPITGYVVTPYIGTVAQTPRTFSGTSTSQVVTGLTPGTAYTFTVAGRTSGGSSVLYRVNAGGPLVSAIDGGLDWSADAGTDNPLRSSGSLTTANSPSATFDSTVPSTTPSVLFDTDRYDPGSKGNADEMGWQFPVTTGSTVRVRLYFANRYVPTGQVGNRVFDVSLDGSKVLDQFDMVAGAGGDQRATMREFAVTSDGTVNIDFTHEVENPLINGIEIIQTGIPTTGPPSAASTAATPNSSPTLTFAAPPGGNVNLAYSNQLTVAGGTSPYTWSVSSGALPAGLTLGSTTGLLSGTPTASGTFNATIQVVDASGVNATKAVTLVIGPALVLTFAPTAGEVSVTYSYQPLRTGGTARTSGAAYSWTVAAGSLPTGLNLDPATGLISGTPTGSGSYPVTIAVADAFQTVSKTGTITIAALPTITSGAPPGGQVGVSYSSTFVVSGGTTPYVWSVSAGALPPGLALDSATGVLSGTPTTIGTSSFTVLLTDAYAKTATKAVTLVVSAGPLVINKTANVSSVVPGGRVTYTVSIANTSTSAFAGVAVSDPLSDVLDDATYNADATASAGTLTYGSSTLSWSGTVPASGTVTITYSVQATTPPSGNKVLTNTVSSATLGTNCAPSSGDLRCVAVVTVSGLSVVHTASGGSTTPGSTVGFTIVATNTGQTSYAGAALSESLAAMLDDATFNGNAAASSGSVAYSSPTLSWTGSLAAGASVTITYSVTVTNPDVGDRSLSGTVVSPTPGSTCPSGSPAASCTATVTVLVPALSITNTAGVSTTTPGSSVPYTVVISNTGQTTYTQTSMSIALAAALDDATYDGNAAATTGTVVFDSGAGTLVWTGTLAPGATATVTASVTVRDPDPADRVLTTVASSSAAGSTCPVGSVNPACATSVQVRVPQLTIAKSSSVTSTTPGSVVSYTVLVTNSGQTDYAGATFTDSLAGVLDDATYNSNAAATAGTVSFAGTTVSWTGALAIGASATITYSVTVRNPDPGNRSMSSNVVSTTPGSTCPSGSSDTRCVNVVTVLVPALSVTTTTDVASATPGQVVHYSIVVENTGQTAYTSIPVSLGFSDVYDDATTNNDGTVSTGSLQTLAGGAVVWTLSLAPGASATGTTSFTVNPTTTRGRVLRSTVSSDAPGSSCPTGSASTACQTTVSVLVPELTLTKTVDKATVQPGGAVGYTIVVKNTGESSYAAASFNDPFSGVLDDATYAGGAAATVGTVSYASPNLSWTGALAPGSSATITYTVTVRDPDPGDKRLANTVVSTTAGSNCASTSSDTRCTAGVSVLVPGLTISKAASVVSTAPRAVVGYTITVTNSGATDYTGATFSDPLVAVLDDATYNANVATTSGTVGYAGSTISWSGNLAVGASATITYSVTVHAADGGDNRLSNTVVSPTLGSNCATGGADPRCTLVVPVARLVLERVPVPPATTTPGSVLNLSVRYTNVGQVPYVGIKVDIPRADSSDDLFATGPDVATSGTLVRTTATTQWTGDIPVGGQVDITIIRTVRDPDTGDRQIRAPLQSDAPGSNCPTSGATDPRCTFLTLVLVPGLTITKTASATSVDPGDPIGYTLVVRNSGETPYTAASVSDSLVGVLDDATYSGNATTTSGSVAYSAPTLTWTGDLAVGASATVSYSVTTNDPGTGDKTVRNAVSSSAVGSTCPPNSNNAGCTTATSVRTPGLTLTKSASTASTTLGASVVFTVAVTNTGQTSYAAASFSDPLSGVLDDGVYLPAATTSSSGTVAYDSVGRVLSWSGALLPGASATITYSISVSSPSTGDRVLLNTVTSSSAGSNCAAGAGDARCTTQVEVLNSVALSIVKTVSVPSTVPLGVVTFTVRLTNPTDTTIFGATFTDALTDVLDDASYTSSTANVGVVSFTSPNLTWTGNVAARRTVTVTYTVTVGSSGAGNELLSATTVSTSPSSSNSCLPGSTDPACTVVVPVASLQLTQVANATSVTPGSNLVVTAVYTNTGQVPYTGISVVSPRADTSDDTVPLGDQTASSGTLVRTTSAITWTGDIPVGGSVTVVRTLSVKDPDPGNKVITATLQSDAPGNSCPTTPGSDPRCTFSVAVVVPGLTITKTADKPAVQPGGAVGYTLTVRNSGQTPYTAATVTDALTGLLDDATYNDDAFATSGGVTFAGSSLTWTGDLAVGQTATVTYSVTTGSPATGDKTMVNVVTSTDVGSTCPPAASTDACRTTTVVLTPALTIQKTANLANVTLGSTVTYTLLVRNTGQTSYPSAQLADSLSGVLDDATYNGDATASAGGVAYSGGVLSWSGPLAVGGSATITYTVTVGSVASGDRSLVNVVTSTTPGNTCPAGSTDSRCTVVVGVTNAFSLTITKTADVTSTTAAGIVTYTVKLANATSSAITGASYTDPLDQILDDATYDANAVADGGTVQLIGSNLTWSGTVPALATVTVTYSATVRSSFAGDEILAGTVVSTSVASNNCPAGSTDARCASRVTVSRLEIQQAYTETSTTPAALIHLQATFSNTGQTPYEGITITSPSSDTVDDAIPTGDQLATSGTLVLSATAITWTGNIPVGGTVTVTGTLTVKNPPGSVARVITGTLVSSAPGNNCPAGGTDPRCTALLTVLLPRLTLSTSADVTSAVPGQSVGYTLTIANTGQAAYTGAVVTDSLAGVLDDATYAGNAVASVGAVAYADSTLTWTGDLAIGASATVTYSVTTRDPDPGDKDMLTRLSSTEVGSSCLPGNGEASCLGSVTVLTPALTITKSAGTTSTTLGASVVFTVVVTNSGQTSYPAAGFSDPLAGVLDDAAYLPGQTSASRGTVSYAGGVLGWSGALAVGESATVSYAVSVNTPSAGDRVLANTVTSTSAGSNCAAGSGDGRCAVQVEVLNSVALSIVKTANVASTVPGGTVVFTLRLTNPTATTIFGATVTDSLTDVLDDATYAGATANVGVVSFTSPNLTWTGNVAARRTVTVTYTVTVGSSGAGNELLSATTVSTSPSSSNSCLPGSTDPACTVTVPVASLLLERFPVPPATTTPGSVLDLSVRYTNTGQVPYTGISIDIPRADTSDDLFATTADVVSSGALTQTTLTTRWTGDIPIGQSVTITILRTVRDPDTGNKRITATFQSDAPGSSCPTSGATDARCTFLTVVLVPALTITTATSPVVTFVVPNGVVGYTTTVRNTGETPYVGATVTDSLLGVVDDATYNGDVATTTGSVSFTSPNLTWTGDLAVGQQTTITFTVTAHRPADGDKTMLNRVSSTTAGSTCLPNSGNAACTTTVAVRTPSLSTVITADKATALPGDVVTYTVTTTNDGQTDYPTATFDAPLAGLLDDADHTGAATASSGAVVRSGDVLTWTGSLLQGASATVTYSVKVLDPVPGTGNHLLQQTLTSTVDGSSCLTGSTDPRCSTSVPIASLSIISSADVATVKPTDVVHYSATYTNTGQVPYVGVTVFINVLGAADDASYNGDASATSGVANIVPGQPEVSWTGDLDVGASVIFTSSVTVNNPPTGDKTMTTVTRTDAPGSNCPAGSPDTACTKVITVLTPELTLSKAASTSSTTPGGTVDYTITATNTGQTAYAAARVSDSLASVLTDATYGGNATATSGSVALVGQTLTWTGELATTQTVTITYSVVINNPDLGDKLLLNRVVSDELGSTCPTGSTAAACTATVTVLVPALTIAVAADSTTTTPGAQVGYTVTVSNSGQTPYTGATVSAALAGVLDDATYNQDATSTAGGVLAPSEGALTWTGDLAPATSTTIRYSVTVKPEAGLADKVLRTSVTSPDAGSTCKTASDCVSTVQVLLPRLAVSTTAGVTSATPGEPVRFTISVHNTGETPYAGSVTTNLADVVDDATFDGTISASVGQATYAGTTLTWTGSVATGDTATIAYTVLVRATSVTGHQLVTTVVADAPGSTCATGSTAPACTARVTVLIPQLSISKLASTATTTPGGTVGYTIRIENTGETAYPGAAVVDALDDVLTDADDNDDAVVTGGGSLSRTGSTLTWTGDLALGSTATIVYSVTVKDPDPGDKLLRNAVTSTAPGSSCPPGGDVPACSTSVRVLVPALSITKTANTAQVAAGSPVAYTITVTNTGETPYTPATVTDDLVGVLDDATYTGGPTATSGAVGYAGGTLTWTGDLALGATATITYSVTASYPVRGDQLLQNKAASGSPGATCAPGSTDARCSSTVAVVIPELSITKTVDTSRVVAGGTVRYTIEATNTGQADYAAATLSDSLSGLLDDAAYTGGATATTGSVTYADETLSWTDALGRGDTVVISYSVQVKESLSEDSEMSNAVVSTSIGSTCPPGGSDPACATTTAVEAKTLTLTDLTPSFALSGLPGETVALEDAVSMTVTTNNEGGYVVSARAAGDALLPTTPGNPDSIPVNRLEVRETGTTLYFPLTKESAVPVHRQDGPSARGGDAVTNDFQMEIPFVGSDTYSTELEYIVTAQ